jgi:hypothetical protein
LTHEEVRSDDATGRDDDELVRGDRGISRTLFLPGRQGVIFGTPRRATPARLVENAFDPN